MKTKQMQTIENENISDGVGRLNNFSARDSYIYARAIKDNFPRKLRLVHDQQKGEANWLLFSITVAALAGVMGGVIFLAIHQNKLSNPFIKTAPISSQS